ncbi:MAG TPA: hypothetical protein PKA81_00170 [Clostridia bacterium]|nr:hypothetical protein [Clostridia bacterium]
MSKYDPLWAAIMTHEEPSFRLTFDEIRQVLGFEIDHSFLNYKKELLPFGYQVGKISLKEQTVQFLKSTS